MVNPLSILDSKFSLRHDELVLNNVPVQLSLNHFRDLLFFSRYNFKSFYDMFPLPMRRDKIKSVILLTRWVVLGQGTALNLFWLEPLHCNIIPSRDKKVLEVLVLKPQRADVHLRAEKWILTFCPGICHSPWWTVCPGTAAPRRPRSLTRPTLPQASERQMPHGGGEGRGGWGGQGHWCSLFLHRSCLLQDELLALFSRCYGFRSLKWWKEMTSAEATDCDASVSAFDMTACVRTYTNVTWIITGGYMVHFTTVINTNCSLLDGRLVRF